MPCSFTEFHYRGSTEKLVHCGAATQLWPFRTHHPEEMPISNIYWHGSILMCHCQQPVGECQRRWALRCLLICLVFAQLLVMREMTCPNCFSCKRWMCFDVYFRGSLSEKHRGATAMRCQELKFHRQWFSRSLFHNAHFHKTVEKENWRA